MKTNRQKTWLLLLGISFHFMTSLAFAEGGLKTHMQVFLVATDSKGEEILKKAETAEPGQTIEYRIENRNDSDASLNNLSTYGPIPSNTTYVANSAALPGKHSLRFSVDQGKTFKKEPITRTVKVNGVKKEVLVPPESYTHVRWEAHQDLDAQSNQVYRYRVKVK